MANKTSKYVKVHLSF